MYKTNGDDVSCVSKKGQTPLKSFQPETGTQNEHTASENLFPYFQIGHRSESFQKLTPHPDFQ